MGNRKAVAGAETAARSLEPFPGAGVRSAHQAG